MSQYGAESLGRIKNSVQDTGSLEEILDDCPAEVLGAESAVGDQDCDDSPSSSPYQPSSGSTFYPSQQSSGSVDSPGTHLTTNF